MKQCVEQHFFSLCHNFFFPEITFSDYIEKLFHEEVTFKSYIYQKCIAVHLIHLGSHVSHYTANLFQYKFCHQRKEIMNLGKNIWMIKFFTCLKGDVLAQLGISNTGSPPFWARGQRFFHQHKCIQFIAWVPKAWLLWTVCVSACGKPFSKIVPMVKLAFAFIFLHRIFSSRRKKMEKKSLLKTS